MIRDAIKWQRWEEEYMASETTSHAENLRLADSMVALAIQLGTFPPADPLDGLDHKIRLAKALNVRISPPPPR